jgi:hypothetical protein
VRIRHTRLTRDFLQVPNATVRDDRLSHMARGILVELLSRPDGWKATADDMWRASVAKHGKASPGRRQFRAAFAELKEHGYLVPDFEPMKGGQISTVLTLTDVPYAGTSARPADSHKTPGQTDVPHAGTSVDPTDVPHGGTSARPAETVDSAAQTDMPAGGTSASPARTGLLPARTDVPHGGTSNTEHGQTNTKKNTSSSVAAASNEDEGDSHLEAFGAFWVNYPKKLDMGKAKAEWIKAVGRGVEPARIVSAAQAYARAKAGTEQQFISYPANWLRNERYHDEYAPTPEPNGRPQLRAVGPQTAPRDTSHMTEEEKASALQFG